MQRLQLSHLKNRTLRSAYERLERAANRMRRHSITYGLKQAGVEDAIGIFTWTTPAELEALFELAYRAPQGARALEIGSYLGASTCFIASALLLRGGHLFCVDTWNNETMPEGLKNTFDVFQQNVASLADVITPIRKRSDELEEEDLPGVLDFVFIDGDHHFEAVAADFAWVARRLSREGVVAFHDVGATDHPGVGRVVGEAVAAGWQLKGVVESLVWLQPPQRPA